MATGFAAPLRRPGFRRAYAAQAINLLGDGLTWVGLALVAHQIAGARAGGLLAIALVARVATYVIVAPWAGVYADRAPRRRLLVATCLGRLVLVLLLTVVATAWQLVAVVLVLNVLAALYTPTFNASLPTLVDEDAYGDALALSTATFEVLGVLGPAIAAGLVVVASPRSVFIADAATFLTAAVLLAGVALERPTETSPRRIRDDITIGTRELFGRRRPRLTLLFELASSLAGAAVLVGSIGLVRDHFHRSNATYGIVMAGVGLGAAIAALGSGWLVDHAGAVRVGAAGALITTAGIAPAAASPVLLVATLWAVHGAGQSLVNVAASRAIVADVPPDRHGRAFGAHFAWSHAWWLVAYPIAGYLATHGPQRAFLPLGTAGFALAVVLTLIALRSARAPT